MEETPGVLYTLKLNSWVLSRLPPTHSTSPDLGTAFLLSMGLGGQDLGYQEGLRPFLDMRQSSSHTALHQSISIAHCGLHGGGAGLSGVTGSVGVLDWLEYLVGPHFH